MKTFIISHQTNHFNQDKTMKLHQTAYYHPSPEQIITAQNQVALHDDPVPSLEDTLPSYSANPEEILMAKEALLKGYSWWDMIDGHFAHELNEDADYHFYAIAPTTTNLKKRDNNPYIGKSVVELTELRSKLEDNLWVYPFPKEDVAAALIKELASVEEAESIAIHTRNFGV